MFYFWVCNAMHVHDFSQWTHAHVFDTGNLAAERVTRIVVRITAIMMRGEILSGWWFNSMALLITLLLRPSGRRYDQRS